jgi:hypothetical protein
MCQLTAQEFADLRFQIGTSSHHGGRRYLPYAFTQEGIAMLSSVLRSTRAAAVNVEIIQPIGVQAGQELRRGVPPPRPCFNSFRAALPTGRASPARCRRDLLRSG